MDRKVKAKCLQAANELKRHLSTVEYRSLEPERAFVNWYLVARFGKLSGDQRKNLDRKKDGGLDCIIDNPECIYVFQMKYEVKPRLSDVSRSELAAFEKISLLFSDKGMEEEYLEWIKTVRPETQKYYEAIRRKIIKGARKARFIFVTTKNNNYPPSTLTEVEDAQSIMSLWTLYSEGFTPPTEQIELDLENAWNYKSEKTEFITYVGLSDVRGFLALMDDDQNERLFAQNVRTDLRSGINRQILNTYEKDPHNFWLGNNGIYIVCKKVIPDGKKHKLLYPSVINGSQTLHSIHASKIRHQCKIMVRILQMDIIGNPGVMGAIIRRTNIQNPMKLMNLAAHEQSQLNIARYLDRYKIFYERREREWINEKKDILSDYVSLNIKELTQWLSTLHSEIGFGRARSRVGELFSDRYYPDIFKCYDKDFQSKMYKKMLYIVWSGIFVQNLIYEFAKSSRSFVKISQLLLIRAIYEAINKDEAIMHRIEEMLKCHLFGRRAIPSSIIYLVKESIAKLKKIHKIEEGKHPNIDFTNFFKKDDLTAQAYRQVYSNSFIGKLSRQLSLDMGKIR